MLHKTNAHVFHVCKASSDRLKQASSDPWVDLPSAAKEARLNFTPHSCASRILQALAQASSLSGHCAIPHQWFMLNSTTPSCQKRWSGTIAFTWYSCIYIMLSSSNPLKLLETFRVWPDRSTGLEPSAIFLAIGGASMGNYAYSMLRRSLRYWLLPCKLTKQLPWYWQ